MNQEKLHNFAIMAHNFFKSLYGKNVKTMRFTAINDLEQLKNLIRIEKKEGNIKLAKTLEKDVYPKIKLAKKENRAICKPIPATNKAIIFAPDSASEEVFEEVFHTMSKIENSRKRDEETFVPIPNFLAHIDASREGLIEQLSWKNYAEDCIGVGTYHEDGYNFPKENVPEDYKDRDHTAAVLKSFIEYKEQGEIDFQDMVDISEKIYIRILNGRSAVEAINDVG